MTGEEKQAAEEHVLEVSESIKQYTPRKRAEHLTEEEMNMAALAHASVLLGFITGGLAGVAIAFIIWLIYKDKSRYVAFHAIQAVAFQLVLMGVTIAAVVAIVVSALTICLIPLALVLLLGAVALPFTELFYGLYAAYETYYGADFTYWKVGEFVKQEMEKS